ncbi:hypothetical protein Fot_35183 [Forsythia ovata]|uniref:Uncharacterized protein n=1 Tax=Forsythia ovata TaxID=205694 RepID=A0ABD1SKS7_9LAMI
MAPKRNTTKKRSNHKGTRKFSSGKMKKTEISKSTRTEKKKTMVSVPEGNKHIPEEEVDDSENEDNIHLLHHSVRHSGKNKDLSSRSEPVEEQINVTSSLYVPGVQNVTDDIQPVDCHDVSDMQNEQVANKEHIPTENEKQIIQKSIMKRVRDIQMKHDKVTSHHFELKMSTEQFLSNFGNTIVNAIQDFTTRINNMPINQSVADNVANTKPDTMMSKLVDSRHKLVLINERGTTLVNSSKKRKMVSQLKDFATGVVYEPKSPYDDDELEHDIVFSEEDLRKIDESIVTIRSSDQSNDHTLTTSYSHSLTEISFNVVD